MTTPVDLFREILRITEGAESGGRDFRSPGEPLRSPAGALYKMQVMPSTAAQPGYGVQPASARTPSEYNRVGTDLLRAFVDKYKDPGKAWAAYHSGPGTLEKAEGRYGADWIKGLGPRGRAYVTSNVAALGPQQAQGTKNVEPDELDETAGQQPAGALPGDANAVMPMSLQQFLAQQQSLSTEEADAARKASADRKANYEAARQAVLDRRYGPSRAEQLFNLAAAIGKPTLNRSFGQIMGNVNPALAEMVGANRKAEQDRADALQALKDQYLSGEQGAQTASFKARRDLLATMAPVVAKGMTAPKLGYKVVLGSDNKPHVTPNEVAQPRTQEEFDALKPGDWYMIPSGPDMGKVIQKVG